MLPAPVTRLFSLGVSASAAEQSAPRPGDGIVDGDHVEMDRAFTVAGSPADVWPWLVQLGKQRAGWYFPRAVERLIPPSRRGIRGIDPRFQNLAVGTVIPDYGGARGYFEVAEVSAPHTLVYRSRRGRSELSWAITLDPIATDAGTEATRVCLRLRLTQPRWPGVVTLGGLVDRLTVAGMAAGLQERLAEAPVSGRDRRAEDRG